MLFFLGGPREDVPANLVQFFKGLEIILVFSMIGYFMGRIGHHMSFVMLKIGEPQNQSNPIATKV